MFLILGVECQVLEGDYILVVKWRVECKSVKY